MGKLYQLFFGVSEFFHSKKTKAKNGEVFFSKTEGLGGLGKAGGSCFFFFLCFCSADN